MCNNKMATIFCDRKKSNAERLRIKNMISIRVNCSTANNKIRLCMNWFLRDDRDNLFASILRALANVPVIALGKKA